MLIQKALLSRIIGDFKYDGHELGGILLIRNEEIVDYFVDIEGSSSRLSYRPSNCLARAIAEALAQNYKIAFVHSHPNRKEPNPYILSSGDERFVYSFLQLNGWNTLDMALVVDDRITYYRCSQDNDAELIITDKMSFKLTKLNISIGIIDI